MQQGTAYDEQINMSKDAEFLKNLLDVNGLNIIFAEGELTFKKLQDREISDFLSKHMM